MEIKKATERDDRFPILRYPTSSVGQHYLEILPLSISFFGENGEGRISTFSSGLQILRNYNRQSEAGIWLYHLSFCF